MNKKIISMLIGVAFILAGYVHLMLRFMLAYFFHDMRYVVSINGVGEANFELFMLVGALPFVIYTIYEMRRLFVDVRLQQHDKGHAERLG